MNEDLKTKKTEKKKIKLSAGIIARNEGSMIYDCLNSLSSIVDEIVLFHTGECEDDTIEIAKSFNAKIVIMPFMDNPSKRRVYLYEFLDCDWILHIDADERLSPEAQKIIPKLIKSNSIDAYSFLWPYFDENGNNLEKNITRYKRILWRKSKMYEICLSHTLAETRGIEKKINFNLEHHYRKKSDRVHRLAMDWRKNRIRAREDAYFFKLSLKEFPTYNCSLTQKDVKQKNKFTLIKYIPFFMIFILPPYSFFHAYIIRKYYKSGKIGFENSLSNFPFYYFFLCYYVMIYTFTRKRVKEKLNVLFEIPTERISSK